MSLLIKGMKMPRACQVCPLGHWNKLDKLTGCEIVRRYVPKDDIEFWEKDKPSWCPLVEVPTPHGRLITETAITEEADKEEVRKIMANILDDQNVRVEFVERDINQYNVSATSKGITVCVSIDFAGVTSLNDAAILVEKMMDKKREMVI